ncbi:MAG: hypothetical protein JXR86_03530 [Spirochaetales bacterium]|nr:hypothetical protein [Spirochaetales bacterium]
MDNRELPRFFKHDENFATGAQPGVEGIKALQREGYTAVVNISPESTPNFLPGEGGLVEGLGMDYVHFPVDCSNLRDRHYKMFSSILDGLEGEKVFIHCGGNIKSSNLLHMYRVIEKKVDEKESMEDLLKIQTPEQKWFDYFKRFGMAG